MKQLLLMFALAGIMASVTSCASGTRCRGKGVNKYCKLELQKATKSTPVKEAVCIEEIVDTTP